MTIMKICSRCGEAKEATLENFFRERRKNDGLKKMCKSCCKESKNKFDHLTKEPKRSNRSPVQGKSASGGYGDDPAPCLSCYVIGGCNEKVQICPKRNKLTEGQIKIYHHINEWGPINFEALLDDLDATYCPAPVYEDVARLVELKAINRNGTTMEIR